MYLKKLKKGFLIMNNIFIKFFFSLICLFILLYIISFSIFEIKNKNNVFGGVATIVFTLASIIYSNIIFYIN